MVLDPYGDVIAESRALGDDMVVADLDASVLPNVIRQALAAGAAARVI